MIFSCRLTKIIFRIFTLLLLPALSFGQPKGFSSISQSKSLEQDLSKKSLATKTITADFTQEKNMKMLQDKVTSKGKFSYQQEDKVRIEYITPFPYLLIMSGGNVTVKEGGKVNKISSRSSKTMQSVNRVLMDCMKGTVFQNKDFQTMAFESGQEYLLQMTPIDPGMKKIFEKIQITLQKRDLTVSQFLFTENNGDFTLMKFSNVLVNAPLSNALFSTP